MQHWGAQQTTLHREVQEHNREHKLNCTPHNEKTAKAYVHFGKMFSVKYIKVYIINKGNFMSFSLDFILWEYFVYFWSYCIISDSIYHLLANFQSFFASISLYIQPNFFTQIAATPSNTWSCRLHDHFHFLREFTANGASWTLYSTSHTWLIDRFHCNSKRQQTCIEQIFMLILKNPFIS